MVVLLIVLIFPVFRFLWSVACWFVLTSFIVVVFKVFGLRMVCFRLT